MNFFWSHNRKNVTENVFGIVYNKYCAVHSLIAPSGWHVATNAEWNNLGTSYDNAYVFADIRTETVYSPTHELKAVDGWSIQTRTPLPTNGSGMSIYPSGIVFGDGTKGGRQEFANFWTSDPAYYYFSTLIGAYKNIGYTNNTIYRHLQVYSVNHGFSLRLVKDSAVEWVEGTKLTDIDGNIYSAKLMADGKVWLTENYQTNTLRDGTPITYLKNKTDWANANYPAFTHYNIIE